MQIWFNYHELVKFLMMISVFCSSWIRIINTMKCVICTWKSFITGNSSKRYCTMVF